VYVILWGTGSIGSATARTLVTGGATVALAARNGDRLEELAGELGGAQTAALDGTRTDAVESFVRWVTGQVIGIDGGLATVRAEASARGRLLRSGKAP
jgi:NADP-dependent 3-hydroxy acid dehydrogenase YdfG